MRSVLDFGSLNYDFVYQVPHMVRPGETLSSTGMEVFCGGKGLNQAIALRKAGGNVYLAGAVGEDGEHILAYCRGFGLNVDQVRRVPGKTGHAMIQLDARAQNSILIYGGANKSHTPADITAALKPYGPQDILLLQNEVNGVEALIEEAGKRGMQIVLNPSPWDDSLKEADLSGISVFLINETEGAGITGRNNPREILAVMGEMFPKAETVLTLGADGCYYQKEGRQVYQKAILTTAVDTTAAGDTFAGYYIAGMLKDSPIEERLLRCALASSIAVSREGAAPSIPLEEEVERAAAGLS